MPEEKWLQGMFKSFERMLMFDIYYKQDIPMPREIQVDNQTPLSL
jgi:hypothetical protein